MNRMGTNATAARAIWMGNWLSIFNSVDFFPSTEIYTQKIKLIPTEEETFSIVNKCTCYTLESQPIGKNHPILLIVLVNNK